MISPGDRASARHASRVVRIGSRLKTCSGGRDAAYMSLRALQRNFGWLVGAQLHSFGAPRPSEL
jgi:hypothetical protein